MALSFPSWREPEGILEVARLAVAEREGLRREDIARRLTPLHGGDRVVFFDMPRIDVSSSAIRERVAAGTDDPAPRPRRRGAERSRSEICTDKLRGGLPHEHEP